MMILITNFTYDISNEVSVYNGYFDTINRYAGVRSKDIGMTSQFLNYTPISGGGGSDNDDNITRWRRGRMEYGREEEERRTRRGGGEGREEEEEERRMRGMRNMVITMAHD